MNSFDQILSSVGLTPGQTSKISNHYPDFTYYYDRGIAGYDRSLRLEWMCNEKAYVEIHQRSWDGNCREALCQEHSVGPNCLELVCKKCESPDLEHRFFIISGGDESYETMPLSTNTSSKHLLFTRAYLKVLKPHL